MYHISNDIRVKKSVQLICHALSECLKTKKISEVTVTDISRVSSVSRSTFYRSFDNVIDVLAYQCDLIFEEAITLYSNTILFTQDFILLFIKVCLEHRTLIREIVSSNRVDLLYNSHLKYSYAIKDTIFHSKNITDSQMKYILSFLTAAIVSVITTREEKGITDSPEEVYEYCKRSIEFLNDNFFING